MSVVITTEKVEKLSDWFEALSCSLRVKIILILFIEGEQRVFEIAEKLKIRQSLISQHLKVLRDTGVVKAKRKATNVYYSLAPKFKEFFNGIINLPPIAEEK